MIGRLLIVLSLAVCHAYAKAGGYAKMVNHSSKAITLPRKISLEQAESIALERAPAISRAYFNTQAAKQGILEARSQLFPQVEGDVDAVGTNRTNIRIGASGALNNPLILNRESNGLNMSQLIFDFGRTLDLTAAARFHALSEAQREQMIRAQLLLQVAVTYFSVLKAEALLKVANETVAARQNVYDEVAALAKSKLKSDLDRTYAQVNLEQAKQLVLQANNAIGVAYAELSEAMGLKEVHRFELSDAPLMKFPSDDLGSLVATALNFRPEILALRDDVNGFERTAIAERDARFPRVDALGSVGRTTIGSSAVQGNYAAAGVNVAVPLFTGGLLSARQAEATLRASAEKKALEEEEDRVVKEVNAAWFDASTALKNIDVANQLAATSEQALELAKSQFQNGQTSIIEYSQAQLNALQAEISAASAKYDYQAQRVQLDYQTGTILLNIPGQHARKIHAIGAGK
jgi:outer membrane protein